MSRGRVIELRDQYLSALAREPDDPAINAALAQIFEELDEPKMALAHYLAAARLFAEREHPREAAENCVEALALDPNNKYALDLLTEMRRQDPLTVVRERVDQGQVVIENRDSDSSPNDQTLELSVDDMLLGPEEATVTELELPHTPPPSLSDVDLVTAKDADMITLSDAAAHRLDQAKRTEPQESPPSMGLEARALRARAAIGRKLVSPQDRTLLEKDDASSVEDGRRGDTVRTKTKRRRPTSPLMLRVGEATVELTPQIQRRGIERSFRAGHFVYHQGDEGTNLYVMVDGQLELLRRAKDEPFGDATMLRTGAVFGELGLLGDGRRYYSARAKSRCRVLVLGKRHVRELMQESKQANRVLRRCYRERLQSLVARVSPLLTALPPSLVANLFAVGKPVSVVARTIIIPRGKSSKAAYLILLGSVELMDGQTIVHRLDPGDCFGHISLMKKRPQTLTARSVGFTQLLRFEEVELESLLRDERIRAALERCTPKVVF
jgi:CRP-like cAMP-binding protein